MLKADYVTISPIQFDRTDCNNVSKAVSEPWLIYTIYNYGMSVLFLGTINSIRVSDILKRNYQSNHVTRVSHRVDKLFPHSDVKPKHLVV